LRAAKAKTYSSSYIGRLDEANKNTDNDLLL